MKILIDECLPRALERPLVEPNCQTVREMGWSGKKNGELLTLAEAQFDVLVTIDQAMETQQNVTGRAIALLVLSASSDQMEDLAPLLPLIREALDTKSTGIVMRVGE